MLPLWILVMKVGWRGRWNEWHRLAKAATCLANASFAPSGTRPAWLLVSVCSKTILVLYEERAVHARSRVRSLLVPMAFAVVADCMVNGRYCS